MEFESLRERLLELDAQAWATIKVAAEAGDSEAQFLLGYRLYDTRLEHDDCERWLREAATQGHPEALYHLSQTTFRPELMTATCPATEEGLKLLTKAAELGSVNAQRDLAVCFIDGEPPFEKDWSKARFWYYQAAGQGHQESQATVGSIIVRGEGGPANHEEGLALLERAANGPETYEAVTAAGELALYYSGAFGVPVNAQKTAEWEKTSERLLAAEQRRLLP